MVTLYQTSTASESHRTERALKRHVDRLAEESHQRAGGFETFSNQIDEIGGEDILLG